MKTNHFRDLHTNRDKMHAEPQTVQDMPVVNSILIPLLPEAPISLLHFHPHVNDTHFKRISGVI